MVLSQEAMDFNYLLEEAREYFRDSTLNAVRPSLLDEVRTEYYRGLKTAVLNYFLLSDMTRARMAPLSLPVPARQKPPAISLAVAVTGGLHLRSCWFPRDA